MEPGWGVGILGLSSLRGSRVGLGGPALYQAIVVLGLQVDGSNHVHPHQAQLGEVFSLRPSQELAWGLGGFWILRKGVDAEETLGAGRVLGCSSVTPKEGS